jgi:hypothetical protein
MAPAPSTRSSELVRIAAAAASRSTSSIQFQILHGSAGLDPRTIREDSQVFPSTFSLFSAAGLTACASTWPSSVSAFPGTVHINDPQRMQDGARAWTYSGFTVPNPGFLNESTRRIEALVTLGNSNWSPTYRDCLMTSLVIEQIAELANRVARGPLLYLHSPVAPFRDQPVSERGDGSSEGTRDAVGPCIRIAVGLDPTDPTARLRFEVRMTSLAAQYGLGLRLNDRRLHRTRGEWFTIRKFDREAYRAARDVLFGSAPSHAPKRAVLATVTGPARVGLASEMVGALRRKAIGTLAASVTSMQKIAFMTLLLPTDSIDARPFSGSWESGLAELESLCGPGTGSEIIDLQGGESELLVADHKVAISQPLPCSYPAASRQTGASVTGRVPYPVWLAWQVPHRTIDTPRLLAEVGRSLASGTSSCEVLYAQSRLLSGDLVRGRAKLVVVLEHAFSRAGNQTQQELSLIAELAQERTLDRLLDLGVEPGQVRLRLSPRERWLTYGGGSA